MSLIMKREEFIATVGYQGDTALVDKNLLRTVKDLDTGALLEKGFYKAAFCSALYKSSESGDFSEEQLVLENYNNNHGVQVPSVEALKRIFGVYNIPEHIERTSLI